MDMYNFQLEYNEDNGNMIISHKNGISNNELDLIQINMLQANKIPGLLSIQLEEIDSIVKIKYNIGSNHSLKYHLLINKLSTNQYLKLLLNIIKIITDSKKYMLNINNYILDTRYIYVTNDTNKIYLTYLPFKNIDNNNNLQIRLEKLAVSIMKNIDKDDVYYKLLNFMKNEDFNLIDLKKKLISLLSETDVHRDNINFKNKSIKKNNTLSKINFSYIGKGNLSNKILYSLSILTISLIWIVYIISPNLGKLYISIGLTILIIDLIIVKSFLKSSFNINNVFSKDTDDFNEDYYHDLKMKTTILEENMNGSEKEEAKDKVPKAYLKVENKNNSFNETIKIVNDSLVVGRNNLVGDYYDDIKSISRIHFEIIQKDSGYSIRDLFSTNGTLLNNKELIPNKIYPLKNKDIISIGKLEFVFRVE